jgi:hypothetical protein
VPKEIAVDDVARIEKLAVVSRLTEPELQVLDHTGDRMAYYQPYTGNVSQDATSGAMTGVVSDLLALDQIGKSLDGDPDVLREALADFPAAATFNDHLCQHLELSFPVVGPDEMTDIDITELAVNENATGQQVRDYSPLRGQFGVDSVLEIDYIYGIAAYAGRVRPSVVIAAGVRVIDLEDNEVLMSKVLASDLNYKRSHSIDEFAADDGRLFRDEFIQDTCGMANLIARAFGVELSEKHRSHWSPDR